MLDVLKVSLIDVVETDSGKGTDGCTSVNSGANLLEAVGNRCVSVGKNEAGVCRLSFKAEDLVLYDWPK
ncbi:hypothetical protein TNCT_22541 [Trichonephila clavata]|uniref:Uncharacterized protein n=1 Tax=Trichonephila clavata TaxID=2740835 RepID=A0A8X6GYF9_TRICU|nr:hypothetical protein TNCT_22541 [Trichonephila clavata]